MLELGLEYSLYFRPWQLLELLSNFRKRQVLLLKSSYELEPVNMLGAVMSARAARFRCGKQSLLDVIPDGARADASSVAQLEEVDGFGVRKNEHVTIMTVLLLTVKYP